MKAIISGFEEEKRKKKEERLEEINNLISSIENIITQKATDDGIDIDQFKSMIYSYFFEKSHNINLDEDFVHSLYIAIYGEKESDNTEKSNSSQKPSNSEIRSLKSSKYKKNGEYFINILISGKQRYEEKVKKEALDAKHKVPFLERAKFPLDALSELNSARQGYKPLPKLTSLEAYERLETIRNTIVQIETFYNCSEEQAIKRILDNNLLPDEVEILQKRLNNISQFKSSDENASGER